MYRCLSPGVAARANQKVPKSSVSQRQCIRAGAAGINDDAEEPGQEQESASVLIRPLPFLSFLMFVHYLTIGRSL